MADDQRFFFLNMTQAGVKGGSTKTGHPDWLELDNWDFSMNQTADPNVKGGRPTKTSATGRFGFSIKHNGPQLFKLAATGQFINTPITFEAERAGLQSAGAQSSSMVYFQLVFNRAVVSHRSVSGDDGQKTEHIELVFEKVDMTYKQVINGMLGSAIPKSYDAKSNQVA
jgi:type VI protein secretion system component Hcp